MNQFGALPKETVIEGQPHMLAYINPEEEKIIQEYRGNIPPIVGPNGVPAYNPLKDFFSAAGEALSSAGSAAVNAVSSAVSKGFEYASDAGSAAGEFITNLGTGLYDLGSDVAEDLYEIGSDAVGAAGDTLTEIVTLGQADTETYNPTTSTGKDTTSATTEQKWNLSNAGSLQNAYIMAYQAKGPGAPFYYGGSKYTAPSDATYQKMLSQAQAAALKATSVSDLQAEVDANVLYEESLGDDTQAEYDMFGDEYETQAEASAADKEYSDQSLQVFYDSFGNEYGTQIEANKADLLASAQSSLDGPSIQDLQTNLDNVIGQGFSEGDPPYEQAKEQLNAELGNLQTKMDKGQEFIDKYVGMFGWSHVEDRFKVGRINPATGEPWPLLDYGEDYLDADTMPYTPDGLDFDEIIYLDGEPFESTVDGVDIGVGTIPAISTDTSTDTSKAIIADDVSQTSPVYNPDGTVTFPDSTTQEIITTTYPSYRTGMAGGMWDRFAASPYSRFGVAPVHSTQVVNKIEQEDGSTVYYDDKGNVVDPYA
jgi:hypothetical protein